MAHVAMHFLVRHDNYHKADHNNFVIFPASSDNFLKRPTGSGKSFSMHSNTY